MQMTNMKRWSYAKLDRQLIAAQAVKNNTMIAAIEKELNRRDSAAELAGIQSLNGRI